MEQNGGDNDGILGFLREDILKEYRRGKRMTCWYCKRSGATVGCCMSRCKKVFHLPCGRREGSLHQFFGQFKSFCASHRPAQKISPEVLMEVKDMTAICPICCDDVYPMSCLSAIWAPCCSSKSWFHRDCVQRLALSAGYFFKCPLCNNKSVFQKAMLDFGIYIPEQDASWELEPNAFQELLHRHNRCDAKHCVCPKGRSHAMVGTRWELVLCRYCGSQGIHVGCGNLKWSNPEWECDECTLMLQQAQERGDTDSDEEPDPSPASVNQVPAKRKRRYFKGSGGPRRTKYRKHSMLNSSSHPHPSSSRSPVIPKGESTAMTGGPVSPPTPIAVIEVSDDDIIEILDDDDDDDDDDDVDDDGNLDDQAAGKTSTPCNERMILSCDGKAIPVIQVTSFAMFDNGQNFSVVGDLDVKLPCHLYDVQQVAQPAASDREMAHISGVMVPGSSVDSSRSSKSLHSSVDGDSSNTSVHSSPAFSHSGQPSASGTARGSLLKSYLTSENVQGGLAYPAEVLTVAPQVDGKTPARTESQNPNTCSVQHSAPSTSSQKAAALPQSRVYNRPHGDRCDQQHGSCISTPSQQESRHIGDRLTGYYVLENLNFRATSIKKLQVEGVIHKIMTVDLPLPLIQKLFQNHVIQTVPAVPQNVTVAMTDSNVMTPQVPHLKNPEQSTMCSSQEAGVGESYQEKWVDYSYSEKQVDDAHSERGLGDTYSEIGVGVFYSQRGLSEIGVGDSYSERGLSEIGVDDSYSEKGLSEIGVGDSYSERGLSEIGVDDSYSEKGLSEIGVGDSYSERGLSEMEVGDSYSDRGLLEIGVDDSCSGRGLCDTYSEIGVGDSYSERGLVTYSDMGLSDTYSETGVGSQAESQFDCCLRVTSYSPIMTRSRSRCVLHNNRHLTRSLAKKMQETRSPSCRCETCRETNKVVGKKGSKSNCNRSVPDGEVVRRRKRRRHIGSGSCGGTPHKRRRQSWSRSTRKHHSTQNTFSPVEIGVDSYSENDSYSGRGVGNMPSGIGVDYSYSEIGVDDSQAESQFDCRLRVTSYSPVITRSRSRCVLRSNTHLTRSMAKKIQGARYAPCRCETCRETKKILGKDSKVNCNKSGPHGELIRRRRHTSGGCCGGTPCEGRRHSWSGSTRNRHSTQNTDGSLAFLNEFRVSMQAKSESGMKQECVTEDKYNSLNVISNSQSKVVCSSGIGVSEVTGIDCSSSSVPQHHNSEDMEKQMRCINMDTGVDETPLCKATWNCPALSGCLKVLIAREEALRACKIFPMPQTKS